MPSHTVRPKEPERHRALKSSIQARRLIRHALKLTRKRGKDNQSAAARLLKLPNSAQLYKMLRGEIKDTPAMELAKKRAERRYYNLGREAKPEHQAAANRAAVDVLLKLNCEMATILKGLIDGTTNNSNVTPQPGEGTEGKDSEHSPAEQT